MPLTDLFQKKWFDLTNVDKYAHELGLKYKHFIENTKCNEEHKNLEQKFCQENRKDN